MKACFSRLNKNTEFASFASFVADAQDKYLVPLIGQETVDELQTWYDDAATRAVEGYEEIPQDIANTKLLYQVQRALTYYTLLEAAPGMLLDIGDNGLVETSADNTTGARQWTVRDFSDYLAENADIFAESLLSFLEKNKADYEFWDTSDFRKETRKLFVDSGTTLARYVAVNQPRRFFLGMLRSINRVEDLRIRKILGDNLFEELKTQLSEGALTEENEKLLAWIQPVVAFLAMVDVLPSIVVTISSNGIKVLSENDGIRQRQAAGPETVQGQVIKHINHAAEYEAILLNFLHSNAADYPLFEVPQADEISARSLPSWSDNDDRKSFRF